MCATLSVADLKSVLYRNYSRQKLGPILYVFCTKTAKIARKLQTDIKMQL